MTLAANEPMTAPLMVLPESAEEVALILAENFAPGMSPRLVRVKMPTGGGLSWSIPASGGMEQASDITGVVLTQHYARAYWKGEVASGVAPDCSSQDGIAGTGNPGGSCERCPMNRWGSSPKGGRAKACNQTHRLYILRSGAHLPILVALSPGSLTAMLDYQTLLSSEGLSLRGVVTTFSLLQKTNGKGQVYSVVAPWKAGALTPKDKAKVRAIGNHFAGVVQAVHIEVEAGEVATGDDEPDQLDGEGKESSPPTFMREAPLKSVVSPPLPPKPAPEKPLPKPDATGLTSISGEVVAEPTMKYTGGGRPTTGVKVRLAGGDPHKGAVMDVAFWDVLAEEANQRGPTGLHTGQMVTVQGKMSSYKLGAETRYYLDASAYEITRAAPPAPATTPTPETHTVDDELHRLINAEDLPF